MNLVLWQCLPLDCALTWGQPACPAVTCSLATHCDTGKREEEPARLFLPGKWELCAPAQSDPRQSCQRRMGPSTPKSQSKYLWSPRGRCEVAETTCGCIRILLFELAPAVQLRSLEPGRCHRGFTGSLLLGQPESMARACHRAGQDIGQSRASCGKKLGPC